MRRPATSRTRARVDGEVRSLDEEIVLEAVAHQAEQGILAAWTREEDAARERRAHPQRADDDRMTGPKTAGGDQPEANNQCGGLDAPGA